MFRAAGPGQDEQGNDALERKIMDRADSLQQIIDECERHGDYPGMVRPLTELVEVLGRRCTGGGCVDPSTSATPEYAAALDRLGGLHRNLGDLDRSLEIYTQAVGVSAHVFGADDPNYATTLNNMAGLYRLRQEWEEAEEAYARAETVYERTLGPTHVLTVSVLNNRGLLRQDQGRVVEAIALHTEALDRLADNPEGVVARATTLNNLATAHYANGELSEAQECMAQAAELYRDTVGKESDLYLGCVHNLGSLALANKDYEAAAEALQWAAQRAVEVFGPNNPNTQRARKNLAQAYRGLGRDEEAREIEEQR